MGVAAGVEALARIPPELSDVEAAPLLCAGITTFNALRNSGARAGDLVAILGVGGLGRNGTLLIVGVSPDPVEVPAAQAIKGRHTVQGWQSGTAADSQDTLAFSALAGVRPLTEEFPLERAEEACARMMSGEAQFRVVLKNA